MNIEKIEVNGHYVWVDKDAEICNVKGREDWNYCPNSNQIFKGWDKDSDDLYMMGKNLKPNKIIAASPELSLEGIPTYVEWLAETEYKKDPFWIGSGDTLYRDGLKIVNKNIINVSFK